ncbi:E3 ubiquitin protein ligase UPL5 [Tanacetum coccineum]
MRSDNRFADAFARYDSGNRCGGGGARDREGEEDDDETGGEDGGDDTNFFRKKSGNAAVQAVYKKNCRLFPSDMSLGKIPLKDKTLEISPATCRWRKGRNVAGESIECCSGLTFIWEVEELGSKKVVELLPRANRKKYIDLLIRHQFVTSIAQQLEDLDGMLHGNESAISVDDWKAHTEYDGYKETDPQICWFWEVCAPSFKPVFLIFWLHSLVI